MEESFCSCKTSCFHHPYLFPLLPLSFLLFELKDQRSAVGEDTEVEWIRQGLQEYLRNEACLLSALLLERGKKLSLINM